MTMTKEEDVTTHHYHHHHHHHADDEEDEDEEEGTRHTQLYMLWTWTSKHACCVVINFFDGKKVSMLRWQNEPSRKTRVRFCFRARIKSIRNLF